MKHFISSLKDKERVWAELNNADCTCKITVPKDAVLKLIDGND